MLARMLVGSQFTMVADALRLMLFPAMMAFAALPPKGCVPYRGTPEQVAAEATKFILRGIGMTAAAIAAHRDGHNSPQLAAD